MQKLRSHAPPPTDFRQNKRKRVRLHPPRPLLRTPGFSHIANHYPTCRGKKKGKKRRWGEKKEKECKSKKKKKGMKMVSSESPTWDDVSDIPFLSKKKKKKKKEKTGMRWRNTPSGDFPIFYRFGGGANDDVFLGEVNTAKYRSSDF